VQEVITQGKSSICAGKMVQSERTRSGAKKGSNGPVRRRPGRPTLSNEELLDTALDLFLENGFDRTSIDAITSAAGMAKRTIYARYGDKTNLFKAALTRAIEEWVVPLDKLRAAECDDFEQTLVELGRLLVANALGPSGLRLMRLTNAESVRMPEISTFSVRHGTEPTVAYLADLFQRRFPSIGLADAREAGQAFLNLVVGGPASNAAWGMTIEAEQIERHLHYSVRLFLHGLLVESGASGRADGAEVPALLDKALGEIESLRSSLERAKRLASD